MEGDSQEITSINKNQDKIKKDPQTAQKVSKTIKYTDIQIILKSKKQSVSITFRTNLEDTLHNLREQMNPMLDGYQFVFKEKKIAAVKTLEQRYLVKQLLKQDKITLIKKQSQNSPEPEPVKPVEPNDYILVFSGQSQSQELISCHLTTKLSQIRQKNKKITSVWRFDSNGTPIAQSSENTTTVQKVLKDKKKIVLKKDKPQAKTSQEKEKQYKERREKMKVVQQKVQAMKTASKQDYTDFKTQIAALNTELKDLNSPLTLKSDEKDSVQNVIIALKQQIQVSDQLIKFAQNSNTVFQKTLADNEFILKQYWIGKQRYQKTSIIDFINTPLQRYKQGQKDQIISVISFQQKQFSKLQSQLTTKQNYSFIGATVSIDSPWVSAQVSSHKSQMSYGKSATVNRSAGKNSKMRQIYISFSVNNIISFPKKTIKLLPQVINRFQSIVQKSIELKSDQKLRQAQINRMIDQFIDQFGDGIETGVYCLGGKYQHIMDYEFKQDKTAAQLTTILADSTDWSVSASAGGSYWGVSVSGSAQINQKNSNYKGTTKSFEDEQKSYTCSCKTTTDPLNYITNQYQWTRLMRTHPNNWKLLKLQEKQKIKMVQLLENPVNLKNTKQEFRQERKKILQKMNTKEYLQFFKFTMNGTHKNKQKYKFNQQTVTKIHPADGQSAITSQLSIPNGKISYLDFIIKRTHGKNIFIGIVTDKFHLNKSLKKNESAIIYYDFRGTGQIIASCPEFNHFKVAIYPTLRSYQLNKKFRMIIDLVKFTFKCQVDGKIVGQCQIPSIMTKGQLYPFISADQNETIITICDKE